MYKERMNTGKVMQAFCTRQRIIQSDNKYSINLKAANTICDTVFSFQPRINEKMKMLNNNHKLLYINNQTINHMQIYTYKTV